MVQKFKSPLLIYQDTDLIKAILQINDTSVIDVVFHAFRDICDSRQSIISFHAKIIEPIIAISDACDSVTNHIIGNIHAFACDGENYMVKL